MEYDKINNLLDIESEDLSKFVTRNYFKLKVYLTSTMNQLEIN